MSMDGLRKGASTLNQGKGKGKARSAYYTRWKPPQVAVGVGTGKQRTTFDLRPFLAPPPHEEAKIEAAEPVVLIAGDYEDIFATYPEGHPQVGQRIIPPPKQEGLHVRIHTFNVFMKARNPNERGYPSFRELVCSAGPDPHAPQPCVGCYKVDHGEKDSRARDSWVFNMAHLAWYHLVPFVKDNQVQMKNDGSGPIMIKVECMSHKMENVYLGRAVGANRAPAEIAKRFKQCEGCRQQAQWAWGDHRTLQLGYKHLKNIFAIDDDVSKKCINCGTGILRIAFDCEKCDSELLNLSQVSWTNDQIDQYAKAPAQCACGHVGLPKSAYECGFDDNFNRVADPCDNPLKTSIFDCVLWLQREGESTESEVVVRRVETIAQYQARTFDQRPLPEHLKEIVKEPFNLVEMYKPENLDDQAESIKTDNPYAQQQQQYGSYGGQQQPAYGGYPQGQQQPNYPQNSYQPPGAPGGYAPPAGPPAGYQSPGPAPQGQPGPQQPVNYPPAGRPDYGR
jgi:hypothetical protein